MGGLQLRTTTFFGRCLRISSWSSPDASSKIYTGCEFSKSTPPCTREGAWSFALFGKFTFLWQAFEDLADGLIKRATTLNEGVGAFLKLISYAPLFNHSTPHTTIDKLEIFASNFH
jgi:hypothetical protein